MEILRKYGVATTVYVPLIKVSSNDQAKAADFTHAAGDTKIVKDGGAAANITTAPSAIAMGNGATWKVSLSATEMQAALIVINISDSTTKAVEDQQLIIATYGNASAQHAMDLDDSVRAGLTALPNAAADAAGGLPVSDTGGLDLDTKLANTNEITAARMSELDAGTSGKMANQVDIIQIDTTTDIPALIAALNDPTAATIASAVWDALQSSHVTAGSFGEIATEIAAILVDTDVTIPGLIAALNNLSTAQVNAEMDTALADFFTSVANLVNLIWNEPLSGHSTGGTTGKALNDVKDTNVAVDASVNDAGASAAAFITNLSETTDNHYKDQPVTFIDGSLAGQTRNASGYVGATKQLTFSEPFTEAPANGNNFVIGAMHVHPVSDIADGVLDEALSGHMTAGTLGKAVSDIEANVAAIVIDTNELQTDLTDGGRLDLILDAIAADTGTDGVVLTAAERNAIADAILDRDMSTGTDSGSPTLRTVRQALRASRNKVSISGGVMTVTKEDDTTPSWTATVTTAAGDPITAIDPANA